MPPRITDRGLRSRHRSDRLLVWPLIHVRDQTLLNRDLLNFDGKVPRINDQPVDLYHPGQGTIGEFSGQHPFVVELVHIQKRSDLFRLVGGGALGDAEVTAEIGCRHMGIRRFVTQKVDLPQGEEDGAGPDPGAAAV